MAIFWAILFLCLLLIAWFTNVVGLPGNWLMLAIAVVYWILKPAGEAGSLSLTVLVIMAVLAGVGELLELVMSSAKVKQAGGARRSAGYAIVGSIVGGFFGVIVGVPLPVFGPIVGSLFFGSLGAMAGAIFGEISTGETFSQALQIGKAAFIGRALGTMAKMAVGLVIVCAAVVGMVV
jgi:uncharacterized protein YqgC (DUF456 family)